MPTRAFERRLEELRAEGADAMMIAEVSVWLWVLVMTPEERIASREAAARVPLPIRLVEPGEVEGAA